MPRSAKCAKYANLGSAMSHSDSERVVDDKHPDHEREQAGDHHSRRIALQ